MAILEENPPAMPPHGSCPLPPFWRPLEGIKPHYLFPLETRSHVFWPSEGLARPLRVGIAVQRPLEGRQQEGPVGVSANLASGMMAVCGRGPKQPCMVNDVSSSLGRKPMTWLPECVYKDSDQQWSGAWQCGASGRTGWGGFRLVRPLGGVCSEELLFLLQGHMDEDVQAALLQIIRMRQGLVC